MQPGCVWLHPMHTTASRDDKLSVVPIRLHRKLADVQELHSFASELAHAHQGELPSSGPPDQVAENNTSCVLRVSLSSGGMIITREGEARECSQPLSLRFSEVVDVSAGQQQLIAIGRRHDLTEASQSKKKDRPSLVGPFRDVWVLLVEGDEDVLHRVLDAMGALGAIRANFQSIYQLNDTPTGEGSCAQVYLAKRLRPDVNAALTQTILSNTLNGRRPEAVAAKVFCKSSPDYHESEMLMAEAAHLLAVQCHPNVVAYYGTFTMPAAEVGKPVRWIMALEWCGRGDLQNYVMSSSGACHETRAADILVGLFAALAHVHSCGIVHRDVKADNILIGEGGRPILSDFGIAARLDDEEAMTKRCGSPGYVAPEILKGEKYDFKVDVFSAGVVLYFVLYTALPFAGPNIGVILRRTAKGKVQFPKSSGHVSNDMKNVVLQLLENKSQKRMSAKSAFCLVCSGWSRDRSLPGWLRNRSHVLSGSSPFAYETSSQLAAVAHTSPSLPEESLTSLPSCVATASVAMDSIAASPFEIGCKKVEDACQTDNSHSIDIDQKVVHTSFDGSVTESTEALFYQTNYCGRGALSSAPSHSTNLGLGDPLLSVAILDSAEQNSQNRRTPQKPQGLSSTCNRFWRKVRKPVLYEYDPPVRGVAEAAKSGHPSQQPHSPQAPKIDRGRRFFYNKREPVGDGCQQRGRRIINPEMLRHAEVRSGRVGLQIAGVHDEQNVTDAELSSHTKGVVSKE